MSTERAQYRNPYENRWRWWYPAISDWMIRNPSGKILDCAAELKKHANTISMIITTDMFKEFHAQRQREWQQVHDFGIKQKLTAVAENSLDIMLEQMNKQKDKVPMKMAVEFATSALDRLGYLPSSQGPAVQVNIDSRQQNNTVVLQGVSATELEEARMAMRHAEEMRRGQSMVQVPGPQENEADLLADLVVEAEPGGLVTTVEEETPE